MAWTYTPHLLTTNRMMQVRRLIGDVDVRKPLIQDEEINLMLTLRFSIYGAAADCCRFLASENAPNVDEQAGDTKISRSNQTRVYSQLAAQYEMIAASRGGAMPYAGGISIADKEAQESNTDRERPQFVIGLEDNFIPLAPTNTEDVPQSDGQ